MVSPDRVLKKNLECSLPDGDAYKLIRDKKAVLVSIEDEPVVEQIKQNEIPVAKPLTQTKDVKVRASSKARAKSTSRSAAKRN